MNNEEIKILNQQYETLTAKRTERIHDLKKQIKDQTATFFSIRKQFRKDLDKDNKQIILLTDTSTQSIKFLQKLKTKGEQIVTLMLTCRKFETQREQVSKWLSLGPVTDVTIEEEEQNEVERRASAKSEDLAEGAEIVKKVVISMKSPMSSLTSSSHSKEEDLINREFALLDLMEKFWVIYNKVDLEYKEMKQEKKILLEQNKHFRGMIRAVLEAAALDQPIPESKVSTRATSKNRGPRSAPLRRILV